MEYVAAVTMLTVVVYFVFTGLTGAARGRYNVAAPATTGHPTFERYYRVQQNTVEQLVIFLPSLWLFGYFVNPVLGAAIGLFFPIGRVIYLLGYTRDPEKRGVGFTIGFIVNIVLGLGALGGVLRALV